jgi:hypothetical protein
LGQSIPPRGVVGYAAAQL